MAVVQKANRFNGMYLCIDKSVFPSHLLPSDIGISN